jgi:hypothetical protein
MTHLLTFVACLLGFAALALATERQQFDLFRQSLAPRATNVLRLVGWSALAVALYVIVQAQGWGLGLVSYSGHTSLAAGVVLGGLITHSRVREQR